MIDRRSLMAGLAAAPLLAPAAAQAQDPTPLSGIDVTVPREAPQITPYTIEELFRPAPALDADLSADGKHVALLMDTGEDEARKTQLLIFSADDPTVGEARFRLGDTNVRWLLWAGSERVLLGISGASETNFVRRAGNVQRFTDRRRDLPYRRVMAVPLTGGPSVQLFQPAAGARFRIPPEKFRKVLNLAEVVAVTDGDHALMAAFDKEDLVRYWLGPFESPPITGVYIPNAVDPNQGASRWVAVDSGTPLSNTSLYRLNLATGEPELVMEGSDRTIRWEAQHGEAILRRDMGPDGISEVWRIRPPGQAAWKPIRTVNRAAPDIVILSPSDTPRSFWVLARAAGETIRSVRLWNIDDDTLAAPVSSRPDREPAGALFDAEGRFTLSSYRSAQGLSHDTPDPGLKAILAALAIQFGPGAAVRVMHVAPDRTKVLVEVSGPQQPRAFYLFDSVRRRLADIGGGARLLPERLADAEAVSVPRPGSESLSGVLTGSLDGKPGPLVVILQPAGDTESLYNFDPMAQAFAARGWWTLRLSEGPGAEVDAVISAAVQTAALDSARMAVLGERSAGRAALALGSRFGGAIAFDSPEAEVDLLGGAEITNRSDLAVQANGGGRRMLVIRNWQDARSARISDRRMADALKHSNAGGLADAIAIGEAGDADWTKLETQVARARAVVEFLDPILK